MGDGSTAPNPAPETSEAPVQDAPIDPGLRLVPAPAPRHALLHAHRRLVIHALVIVLAVAGAIVASRTANEGVAVGEGPVPQFAYSGVAGAVPSSPAHSFLRAGNSVRTLPSIATTTPQQVRGPGQTFTGAVGPMTSVSAGVSAAAVGSGIPGAGVTGLADIVDPNEPFAIWVTQPGDSLGSVAEHFDVDIETILDNNPTVTDSNLVTTGQELIVPRADGILHKVGYDETLTSIVSLYDNITVQEAMAFRSNRITNPEEELESGSFVLLPGAVPKPPPPPEPEPEPTPAPAPSSGSSGDSGGSPGAPPSSGGRFSNPLAGYNSVTDEFGVSRALRGGRMHTGIDLGTWGPYSRTTIYSSCNGTVSRTEWLTYSYGYHVVVDCGDGWTTLYAHMSRIDVSVGQTVSQGTPLGATGLTGFTTGEHLHFEIRRNNAPVNPRDYIGF